MIESEYKNLWKHTVTVRIDSGSDLGKEGKIVGASHLWSDPSRRCTVEIEGVRNKYSPEILTIISKT